MSSILFTGLAFSCAGALCALFGDMEKRVSLGLAGFLALNLVIWGRFFMQVFSPEDLLVTMELFLISQALATCSYLATVYVLDRSNATAPGAALSIRD